MCMNVWFHVFMCITCVCMWYLWKPEDEGQILRIWNYRWSWATILLLRRQLVYSVSSHQLWKTYFTWHYRPIILFTTNGQEIFIWKRCKIPARVLQNEILNSVKYEIRFNLGVLNHQKRLNYHLEKDST